MNDLMTPKQAADFLSVKTNALKKYALLLESNGYNVSRNELNYRMYSGQDIAMIRAMLILNRLRSVPLDEAASKVTASDVDISGILALDGTHSEEHAAAQNDVLPVTQSQIPVIPFHVTDLITSLQEEIRARDALHIEFVASIDDRLAEQADINRQLLQQNEELLAKVEALECKQDEERKRSIWSRLLGK